MLTFPVIRKKNVSFCWFVRSFGFKTSSNRQALSYTLQIGTFVKKLCTKVSNTYYYNITSTA